MPSHSAETLSANLEKWFGFGEFREGQEQVARCLLEGRSALAVFPTGGGKSLCYQFPAMMLDGITLVISPLIALMKDQVDALQKRGLPAARLDSSLSLEETHEIYDQLGAGDLKLLYIAPERLSNEGFLNRLGGLSIAMLAIDEAHCISEWGHNFRPDYLKLARLTKTLKIPRVLALTATATPPVAKDIRNAFDIAKEDHVQLSFHRSNLELRVTPCTERERRKLLLQRLTERPDVSTIVYVTLQHTAESVATFLQKAGVNARAYHAGLPAEVRVACQEAFMSGDTPVIVATIAFGMGIDKSDIRGIYHYNIPKSLENYSQEIGRAGRDGGDAVCEMLACADDLITLENFAYGDTPSPLGLRHLVDHLLRQGDAFDVSFYDLSVTNDIRPLVVSTLMTYLELEGVITATRPFYNAFRTKFVRSLEFLVKGYDEEEQLFLREMFAAGKTGWGWLTIQPDEVGEAIGQPRERVAKAVSDLESAGDLIVKPSGLRQGYRVLKQVSSPRVLAERLDELFRKREAQDIDRLRRVVALAEEPGCLTQALLTYFGEPSEERCGHCSRCHGEPAGPLPRSPDHTFSEEEIETVQGVIRDKLPALRSSRQLSRFLCGLTSPAATRARLSRRNEFGLFDHVPFGEVLDLVDSLILE